MYSELCIDTFKVSTNSFPIAGTILHSDHGSQYTSEDFKAVLARHNVIQSLNAVGHFYDNARIFATLKKETLYRIPTYKMKKA